MKNLFKIIAFSLVMTLGVGTMNAQSLKEDQNRPEVVAKKEISQLNDALDLTGEQQRSLFRVLVSHKASIKKATTEEVKSKANSTLNASMKKILTAEQYKKWLTLKQ